MLYAVVEMVGGSLASVGWERMTWLQVAAALVDALFWVVLAVAAVVVSDLARRRWMPIRDARQEPLLAQDREDTGPLAVTSWRVGDDPHAPPRWPGTPSDRGRPV